MSNLPSGTVTFLFTDIEGSTKLWEKYPEKMKPALAKHDALLKEVVESNHGQIIKTTGDGIHAVFTTAIDPVEGETVVEPVARVVHALVVVLDRALTLGARRAHE